MRTPLAVPAAPGSTAPVSAAALAKVRPPSSPSDTPRSGTPVPANQQQQQQHHQQHHGEPDSAHVHGREVGSDCESLHGTNDDGDDSNIDIAHGHSHSHGHGHSHHGHGRGQSSDLSTVQVYASPLQIDGALLHTLGYQGPLKTCALALSAVSPRRPHRVAAAGQAPAIFNGAAGEPVNSNSTLQLLAQSRSQSQLKMAATGNQDSAGANAANASGVSAIVVERAPDSPSLLAAALARRSMVLSAPLPVNADQVWEYAEVEEALERELEARMRAVANGEDINALSSSSSSKKIVNEKHATANDDDHDDVAAENHDGDATVHESKPSTTASVVEGGNNGDDDDDDDDDGLVVRVAPSLPCDSFSRATSPSPQYATLAARQAANADNSTGNAGAGTASDEHGLSHYHNKDYEPAAAAATAALVRPGSSAAATSMQIQTLLPWDSPVWEQEQDDNEAAVALALVYPGTLLSMIYSAFVFLDSSFISVIYLCFLYI